MVLSGTNVNEIVHQLNFSTFSPDGEIGESLIARWVRWARKCQVLPVYEKEINNGKGPRLFCPNSEQLIAPDLFVFKENREKAWWVEAKHKKVFTHYRKGDCWTTGIDLRHYQDYIKVNELSPWPVWLFFLHTQNRNDKRPDEPWPCPTGLFGRSLDVLMKCIDHTSDKYADGMVYWRAESLKLLATLEEVFNANPTT